MAYHKSQDLKLLVAVFISMSPRRLCSPSPDTAWIDLLAMAFWEKRGYAHRCDRFGITRA